MHHGIIVGCDSKVEWLLAWWWRHYSVHNSYPVAFFDFGMSPAALTWCRERGTVHSLPFSFDLKELSPQNKEKWEELYGEGIWMFRAGWFKKPFAFAHAPFEVNCWLDLDCQVMGNLQPLFEQLEPQVDIAMVRELEETQQRDREKGYVLPGEVNYNSGVVVFRREGEIIRHWTKATLEKNDCFVGDQNVLSRLIYLYDTPVKELPRCFNWYRSLEPNPDALIIHYIASWKLEILKMINIRPTDTVSLRAEI